MKESNNIPILESDDIINIFAHNLKAKRKEKGYTQKQIAEILGVTLKTYRSWEKNTLPKTLELINLSTILNCDMEYLLGRINTDTHFKAYIDRTYALTPQAFDKLSLLYCYMTEKKDNVHKSIATDWKIILDYLITTEKGNLLLDQIRQYANSNDSDKKKYCYHALLTGKEQHGYNKILNLNTLSDIICSLNDLKDYMQAIKCRKESGAICLDPAVAFFEVKALEPERNFPNKNF